MNDYISDGNKIYNLQRPSPPGRGELKKTILYEKPGWVAEQQAEPWTERRNESWTELLKLATKQLLIF